MSIYFCIPFSMSIISMSLRWIIYNSKLYVVITSLQYCINVVNLFRYLKSISPFLHLWLITWFVTKIYSTGATIEADTADYSGASQFIRGVWWDSCSSIFCFLCTVWSIIVYAFASFRWDVILSVILRFMASDYPFSIFKLLFFSNTNANMERI
jgi:hypothetical protein